jgi:hypothetical protein
MYSLRTMLNFKNLLQIAPTEEPHKVYDDIDDITEGEGDVAEYEDESWRSQ